MLPSPALVPLVLSMFLVEQVQGQYKLRILVAPCWMEAPWLLIDINMMEDIPHQCLSVLS